MRQYYLLYDSSSQQKARNDCMLLSVRFGHINCDFLRTFLVFLAYTFLRWLRTLHASCCTVSCLLRPRNPRYEPLLLYVGDAPSSSCFYPGCFPFPLPVSEDLGHFPTLNASRYKLHIQIKTKKIQLMLMKRAKAYSSSCSQIVSLSLAISSQFILGVCAATEDRKNQ